MPNPAPYNIALAVEQYVTEELESTKKHSHRTPLDERGIDELHTLAATIYSLGFREGEEVGTLRHSEKGRRQEVKLRAQLKDKAAIVGPDAA